MHYILEPCTIQVLGEWAHAQAVILTIEWLHTMDGTLQQKQATHPKVDIRRSQCALRPPKANRKPSHNYSQMTSPVSLPPPTQCWSHEHPIPSAQISTDNQSGWLFLEDYCTFHLRSSARRLDQCGGLHINDLKTYLIAHEAICGWHSFPHHAGDTAHVKQYTL